MPYIIANQSGGYFLHWYTKGQGGYRWLRGETGRQRAARFDTKDEAGEVAKLYTSTTATPQIIPVEDS